MFTPRRKQTQRAATTFEEIEQRIEQPATPLRERSGMGELLSPYRPRYIHAPYRFEIPLPGPPPVTPNNSPASVAGRVKGGEKGSDDDTTLVEEEVKKKGKDKEKEENDEKGEDSDEDTDEEGGVVLPMGN